MKFNIVKLLWMTKLVVLSILLGTGLEVKASDESFMVSCNRASHLGDVSLSKHWGWVNTNANDGFSCRGNSGVNDERYPICRSEATALRGNQISYADGAQWGWVQGEGFLCKNTRYKPEANALNSSIMLFGHWDYGTHGRADQMIERALSRHYNNMLNIIPTHYFFPEGNKMAENNRFCHSRNALHCPELDKASIAEFEAGMAKWFKVLVDNHVDIAITPHLDDSDNKRAWRNEVVFDPFPESDSNCDDGKNDGSYYCSMLVPMAKALNRTISSRTKVYFAMQGEMGALVFSFPEQFQAMIEPLKKLVIGERVDISPEQLHLGVSFNFNDINGGVTFDAESVATLLANVDFIGISGYGGVSEYPRPIDYNNSATSFARELKQKTGVDLRRLIAERGIELHYSEFGLGGGNRSAQAVKTRAEAANTLWAGVRGPYRSTTDPFKSLTMEQFQKEFYLNAISFFGGESKQWPISAAFIRNLTSWDVQAIYPSSTTREGTYRDETISKWISDFNQSGRSPLFGWF